MNLLRLVWCKVSELKDWVCTARRALKFDELNPVYELTVWSSWVTMAWYTMFFWRHCPPIGQFCFLFLGQLQSRSSDFGAKIFLFLPEMIDSMLGVQLYPTFNVFLLKIFLNGCPGGKHLVTRFKNSLPMLLLTAPLYGGLNHIFSLFLLRFLFVL